MLLVLNNKSAFNKDEFFSYLDKIKRLSKRDTIILCPSTCYLSMCDTEVILGAQDVSASKSLYNTGEVTASQLRSLNVLYCIVGHSDRNEGFSTIRSKIKLLLDNGITPIVCVGEEEESKSLFVKQEVYEMLDLLVSGFESEELKQIIIAYEPKWAINNYKVVKKEYIEEVLSYIKSYFPDNKLLYGGGVNINNYSILSEIQCIDGFLLGRMGNNVDELFKILQ